MSALVDTSILIDYLRGHQAAADLLEEERAAGILHASEITRQEVLAGMRAKEEDQTRSVLSPLVSHPVDAEVARKPARWAADGCAVTPPSTGRTSRSPPPPS